MTTIDLGHQQLEVKVWGHGAPGILMLHDGLGSIEQWNDVPALVAERTGLTVAAYNRRGHGASAPAPQGPWPTDWLHTEADVLHEVIDRLDCQDPLIVGHSDGGSIALIHEATYGGTQGVLTLAAHTWVEPICFDAITQMRAARGRIEQGLSRYHPHATELFEAWSGVWTSADFQSWDVRPLLGSIDSPVWIAQGSEDEYATPAHAQLSAAAVGDNAQSMLLEGGRHLLHYRDPQMVIDLIVQFTDRQLGTTSKDGRG